MNNKQNEIGPDGLTKGQSEIFWESLMTGDVSGAIMNQEKRGQSEQIHSDRLPLDINTRNVTREGLETIGFKFGKVIDDVFIEATLPPGWSKKPTDHSMWSTILDDKGRERCAVFYKAAFYDRSAHLDVTCRYRVAMDTVLDYDDPNYSDTTPEVGRVTDRATGKVIWEGEQIERQQKYSAEHREKYEALYQLAKDWINAHFPDYQNPLAYWD